MFMDTPPDAFSVFGGFIQIPKPLRKNVKQYSNNRYCKKRNAENRFEIGSNIGLSLLQFPNFKKA
ncbi:hypothetical protein ASC72_23390 [Flavobacterium sp. Root420]|nr:hypothetical protein ASC72_23390 [Flavobacterium sp. Root420]